jgi:hypothetical protein
MSPSEETNRQTAEEWRELGFYYFFNHDSARWILSGSKFGLQKFAHLVSSYASDPRNEGLSEHEHIGPYMYLEIMTWSEAKITSHAIAGTLPELFRLAKLISEAASNSQVGDQITIDSEYSNINEATLVLEVQADDFDPASADSALWSGLS